MAWANVASELVTMTESVTPLVTDFGMRAGFRHVKEASEDAPPRTRDFTYEVVSGSRKGPSIQQRRSYADVILTVYYEDVRDYAELVDVMVGDWEAIRDVITDPAQWNRPTSTIESIALFGGDSLFEYAIERVEGGSLLSIRFPVEYTG